MNHIYKVIWNTITQTWVAVSELSRAKGKTKSSKTLGAVVLSAVSGILIAGQAQSANTVGTAKDNSSIVFGIQSNASHDAVAVGGESNARAYEDVAIGYKAISGAELKIENGKEVTHSSNQSSVAVGTHANATYVATTAIGAHAQAINNFATAVGAGAIADHENASAFGEGAKAQGTYSTALGKGASATENYAVALGKEASSTNTYSTSIGTKANATGKSSLAIGGAAEDSLPHRPHPQGYTLSLEDGIGAQAYGSDSAALGASAKASASSSLAVGKLANANGEKSIATGSNSSAWKEKSISMGDNSSTYGTSAVAIGADNTMATKDKGVAVGSAAKSFGDSTLAFGSNATAGVSKEKGVEYTKDFNDYNNKYLENERAIRYNTATLANYQYQVDELKNNQNAARNRLNQLGINLDTLKDQAKKFDVDTENTGALVQKLSELSEEDPSNKIIKDLISAAKEYKKTALLLNNTQTGTKAKLATAKTKLESTNYGSTANAIAIGTNSNAQSSDSIALGAGAEITPLTAAQDKKNQNGNNGVAIGASSKATHYSTAVGSGANATGKISSAFGDGAKALSEGSSAFGSHANVEAQATGGVALGRESNVAVAGGVALGQGSVSTRPALDGENITISSQGNIVSATHITDNDNSPVTDVYAPVKLINDPEVLKRVKKTIHGNAGAVSLGKDDENGKITRQLTHLAPGSADSDAVNVAQLKAVVGSIVKYNVTSPDNSIDIKSEDKTENGVRKTTFNVKMNTDAVKNAAAWKIKANKETDDKATSVRGGDIVTFKAKDGGNSGDTIKITRNGKELTFEANFATIRTPGTGMVNVDNDVKDNWLAKAKNVAAAINASGWTLQANGNNVGLINPGDKVNIATDEGSGITINKINEADKVSTIKLKANVTGLTAGNNVTISSKDGNYTINAIDTNTQASVSPKSGSPITVTKTTTTPNSPDYAVGLNIDNKTLEIKGGKLAARTQAQAIESVEKKDVENNIAEVDVKSGSTKGAANAVYTVAVTKSAVKDAAAWNIKEGSETTSTAVKGGDTLTLSDTNTIDVVHNGKDFTFNAKTANIQTEQKQAITKIDVSNKGITTKTTGGDNTPTGRFIVPTGNDADKHALATAYDVADKVNQTGWNLYTNGGARSLINPGDYVNFKSGNATNATVVTEASEGATISYDVNVDNTTIKIDPKNKLTANTGDVDSVTSTEGNSKKGQVVIHKDPLEPSKTDAGKLATVDTVVKAVNAATWYAKAGNDKDAEVSEEDTKADETANQSAAMKAGETLGLKAGKNLRVKRDGTDFTFALNKAVDLTKDGSLTIGNTTVTDGGVTITAKEAGKTNVTLTANGLDNGGNKIVNVAAGENDNDAVNYKQLQDSISTETVRKADVTNGDNNIVEVDPTAEAGKGTKGATYNISVKESAVKNIAKTAVKVVDGKNTTVTAKDDTSDNSKTYAVNVKGDLTDITSITNAAGNGKVEFKDNGVVNVAGDSPIKLDGKTGDITGLTNKTLDGDNFAKSGRAATEEQLDIVNKKFDNKVSLGGDSGETNKKALSTDGGIKFNVKAAADNKVVTTEATGDDVNIKFSGEEAAKVTNLSYKANNGDVKKVTLEDGLNFTNGTHTTAEVDNNGVVKFNVETAKVDVPTTQSPTFTGKFEAPATDGVATIKNVVDVVNNSGWKISQGADSRGIVKAGDEVSFVGTGGTTVTVEGTSGKRTVTVSSTLGAGEKGEITAVTKDNKVGAEKVGQVKPKSEGDKTKVTTVENVANMINAATWYAKAGNDKDAEVSEEDTKADETANQSAAMKAGETLGLKAGKNLRVKRDGTDFTFALNKAVDLTKDGSLTIGNTTVTDGGVTITAKEAGKTNVTLTANGLDNGGNKIVNVAAGENDNDAVNYKQLKSTERHITPTTYTYNDTDKSVTLTYTDGNGKVVANTEAKIDLSGLASKIKDYSFKTNATGSNLVETGTETTVASGKSVNFAASDNLTLKQEVDKGNVTYTYGLKNQVVVGEKGTPGAEGKPGKDGIDGSIGVNGKDGSAVAINGKDGSIGLNGENGKNGLTIKGQDGKVGVDGKDGETRLVYVEKADPTKPGSSDKTHELATLDDGQKYAGDNYVAAKDNQAESNVIAKKANERLDIVGGAKGNLTEGNIGVNAKDGKLHVQLAEKVNLGDKGSVTIGDTVVNNNGITINSPADLNGVTNKTVSLTNQGLNNGGNKITNVAEGENDTDAVNVKQLKDFKSEVAEGGLTFAGNSGDAHKAKLNSTVNIKGGEGNTDADQFDKGKNVMTKVNGNTVTVSIKKTPEVEGINIIDTTGKVKVKLTQTDEGLKVSDGNNNATRITNVKAGEKDTDAVNVKQLNVAKTEVTAGDNIDVRSSTGANGQTIYKVSANDTSAAVEAGSDHVKVTKAANTHKDGLTTVTDYTVDLSDKTKGDIGKGVKAYDKVTNEGLTFNADKGSTGVKKLGSKVSVNGDGKNITTTADENGVKVSMKDDIKVNSVTAKEVKVGDVNINENGINAGGKRITNVAPGKDGTDAVNVNQLKYVAGNISNQINNVDKGLRAGIAGALASGGLYHVTTAGKSMVSVGAGTYRGQNALAVGYSRLSDNGKVGVKFTVNSNSQGHAGASASVGYQW